MTTGLLAKANDDQLRAILAHEVAHADLGHVAETQTVATGLGIGVMLLEQIIPGSSALTRSPASSSSAPTRARRRPRPTRTRSRS